MTQEAVVTNGNDIIVVTRGSRGIYINPSKGDDVVDFSDIFAGESCIKVERISGTRDLKIYDKHSGYSDDYVIIKDYFTSDAANATNSSVQTIRIKGKDYSINEYINYTGGYKISKGKVNGTQFNDNINFISYELKDKNGELIEDCGKKGLTINAGAGNDTVKGTWYCDNIKVTSGTNYINAFYGKNNITLGTGKDTVYHEFDYGYWTDIINNASSNDCLELVSCYLLDENSPFYSSDYNPLDNIQFIKQGNDLALCYGFDGVSSDNSVVLKNYFKMNIQDRINSLKFNEIYFDEYGEYVSDQTINETLSSYLSRQRDINSIYDVAKSAVISIGYGKLNGVNEYNNYLCGSSKKDVIKGGNNNNLTDYIDAGRSNDKITGGQGRTILKYIQGDGSDTVYLSQGEEFILKYVADDTNIDLSDCTFTESGDNLVLSRKYSVQVTKNGKTKTVTKYDKITFKNYKDAQSISIDLYSEADGGIYGDVIQSADLFKNNGEGFIFNLGKKGAKKSVNLNGTDLDERIFGSKKSDIIYTGGGYDIVNSGAGNDTIYVDAGIKSLKFGNGSGNDIVYVNDRSSYMTFVYDSNSELSYSKSDDKNDLIITNTYTNSKGKLVSDTVTVKDFFKYNNYKIFIQNDDGLNSIYRYISDGGADTYSADELAMLQLGVDNWQNIEGIVFETNQDYSANYDLQCYITE